MAGKRNVKIETPGDPTTDAAAASPDTSTPSTEGAQVATAAPVPTKRVKRPTPADLQPAVAPKAEMTAKQEKDLKGQLIETAKLVGAHEALDWSHLAGAGLKPAVAKNDPEAHLPAASDVDPDTITAPVLTKGGWVLPTNDPRARLVGR